MCGMWSSSERIFHPDICFLCPSNPPSSGGLGVQKIAIILFDWSVVVIRNRFSYFSSPLSCFPPQSSSIDKKLRYLFRRWTIDYKQEEGKSISFSSISL